MNYLILVTRGVIVKTCAVLLLSRCDIEEEPEDEDELMLRATYKKSIKNFKKPTNKKDEHFEKVRVIP